MGQIFMEQINQKGKTLVFCANQEHALAVRDLINQIKTSTDPNYCVRVTADEGSRGDEFLRQFQDNEKTIPTILTTSQKLSTGVDARNVRNIVLMRPINSMIEFKQIIGRGTRLAPGAHCGANPPETVQDKEGHDRTQQDKAQRRNDAETQVSPAKPMKNATPRAET